MNFLFPEDELYFTAKSFEVTHLQTGKIQRCQSLAPLKVVHPHMDIRISRSPANIGIFLINFFF